MQKFKRGYYKADIVNGVYFFGDLLDEPETDIIKPNDFYKYLPNIDENEVITTFIDNDSLDVWEKINDEYGIEA